MTWSTSRTIRARTRIRSAAGCADASSDAARTQTRYACRRLTKAQELPNRSPAGLRRSENGRLGGQAQLYSTPSNPTLDEGQQLRVVRDANAQVHALHPPVGGR